MDRERLVQLFFFGFLALMAYELYALMLPFLMPLAWGILLAFMAHPALIEVEKYVKRRSLSTAIISIVVATGRHPACRLGLRSARRRSAGAVRAGRP